MKVTRSDFAFMAGMWIAVVAILSSGNIPTALYPEPITFAETEPFNTDVIIAAPLHDDDMMLAIAAPIKVDQKPYPGLEGGFDGAFAW